MCFVVMHGSHKVIFLRIGFAFDLAVCRKNNNNNPSGLFRGESRDIT